VPGRRCPTAISAGEQDSDADHSCGGNCSADSISIDGNPVTVLSSRDPAAIDWGALGADIVIESTGRFRARENAACT
jgi:glyceraldehyde-3-phosphate dehydrogenase/erythrose-4-phosphate dehydrogenase